MKNNKIHDDEKGNGGMCKDIQGWHINNKYRYKQSALLNERQECRWLSHKTNHQCGELTELHKQNTLFYLLIKCQKPSAATLCDINLDVNSTFLTSVSEKLTPVSLH